MTLQYDLALIQYRTGRFVESQKSLLDLANSGHVSSDIYDLLGWCYEKQGRTTDATYAFEEAIRQDPSKESSYLDLSTMLITSKKLPAALQVLTRTTEVFPRSETAHRMKGMIEMRMDQFTDAIKSYSRAVEVNPISVESKLGLASARWMAGLHPQAEADFDSLIKQFPFAHHRFINESLCLASRDGSESVWPRRSQQGGPLAGRGFKRWAVS
jgi:tetratricopeptide (TPR) repeat protein